MERGQQGSKKQKPRKNPTASRKPVMGPHQHREQSLKHLNRGPSKQKPSASLHLDSKRQNFSVGATAKGENLSYSGASKPSEKHPSQGTSASVLHNVRDDKADLSKGSPIPTSTMATHSREASQNQFVADTSQQATGTASANHENHGGGLSPSRRNRNGQSLALSQSDWNMVKSAAFMTNVQEDIVKDCFFDVKERDGEVTSESLFDECKNWMRPFEEADIQNFPSPARGISQRPDHVSSQAGANAAAGLSHSSAIAGSEQSENTLDGAGALSSDDGDYVDGSCASRPTCSPLPSSKKSKESHPRLQQSVGVNNVSSTNTATDDLNRNTTRVSETSDSRSPDVLDGASRKAASGVVQNDRDFSKDGEGLSVENASMESEPQKSCNSPHENLDPPPSGAFQAGAEAGLDETDPDVHLAICLELARREFTRLDKGRFCAECELNPRDVTFLPCGHIYACKSCSEPIYTCPCCQQPVKATVNTFLC